MFSKILIVAALATIALAQDAAPEGAELLSSSRPRCNLAPFSGIPRVFGNRAIAEVLAALARCQTRIRSCDDVKCAFACLAEALHLTNDCGDLIDQYTVGWVYHILNDNNALDSHEAVNARCHAYAVQQAANDGPDACNSEFYWFVLCVIDAYQTPPYTNINVDNSASVDTGLGLSIDGPGSVGLTHNEEVVGIVVISDSPDGTYVGVTDKAVDETDIKVTGDGAAPVNVDLTQNADTDSKVNIDTNEDKPIVVDTDNNSDVKSGVEVDSQGPVNVGVSDSAHAGSDVTITNAPGPVNVNINDNANVESNVGVDTTGPINIVVDDKAGTDTKVNVGSSGNDGKVVINIGGGSGIKGSVTGSG